MKKIFALLVAVLVVASTSLVALAAPGSFVSSPSNQQAPLLVKAENASEACEAVVKITAYADRDELSEEDRKELEDAYASIVKTEDVGTLSKDLKNEAASYGISTTDMAVSDLFHLSHTEEDHEGHGAFDIVLKPASAKYVVGILHYSENGWKFIEATAGDEGELCFTTDALSTFAIVSHNGAGTSPEALPTEFVVGIGAIVAALIATFVGIEVNKRRW